MRKQISSKTSSWLSFFEPSSAAGKNTCLRLWIASKAGWPLQTRSRPRSPNARPIVTLVTLVTLVKHGKLVQNQSHFLPNILPFPTALSYTVGRNTCHLHSKKDRGTHHQSSRPQSTSEQRGRCKIDGFTEVCQVPHCESPVNSGYHGSQILILKYNHLPALQYNIISYYRSCGSRSQALLQCNKLRLQGRAALEELQDPKQQKTVSSTLFKSVSELGWEISIGFMLITCNQACCKTKPSKNTSNLPRFATHLRSAKNLDIFLFHMCLGALHFSLRIF